VRVEESELVERATAALDRLSAHRETQRQVRSFRLVVGGQG
jgi:hypothetical protein